jgi:hypothetical protein
MRGRERKGEEYGRREKRNIKGGRKGWRKEDGGRRKEEGERRNEEGGRRKEKGGRRKEDGGRRKVRKERRKGRRKRKDLLGIFYSPDVFSIGRYSLKGGGVTPRKCQNKTICLTHVEVYHGNVLQGQKNSGSIFGVLGIMVFLGISYFWIGLTSQLHISNTYKFVNIYCSVLFFSYPALFSNL